MSQLSNRKRYNTAQLTAGLNSGNTRLGLRTSAVGDRQRDTLTGGDVDSPREGARRDVGKLQKSRAIGRACGVDAMKKKDWDQ